MYRKRAIISRGLYIFTPFLTAVYNQEWLILQTIYLLNKGILQKNQEWVIMARVRSFVFPLQKLSIKFVFLNF
jgi:hypothetical protein